MADYNLGMNITELVAALKDMRDKVRWLKEVRTYQSKRSQEFLCEFNNDHDHTLDCRLLQGEIDHLLKKGYVTELLSEKGKLSYMKNMNK